MIKEMRLFLFLAVFLGVLSLGSIGLGADIVIRNESGLLSVKLKDAQIEKVFKKISKRFKVYVKVYPEMKDIRISVNFQKLPLAEGVKKLVKENYALVTRGNNIERIYILNRGSTFRKRNILVNKLINNKFPELDELKEIVTRNVRKEHQSAKFYDCIPHKHLDGTLLSYVFIYYIGSGNAPDKDTLENIITDRDSKRLYKID